MAKKLVLAAFTGAHVGQRHTLAARTSTIGSAPANDVVLRDRSIEPRHLEIQYMLDRWFVSPVAASRGGASLNGMPIDGRSRLNNGDRLTIGSITYGVSFVEEMEQEVGRREGIGSSLPRLGDYFMRRGSMTAAQVERTAQRQSELSRNGSQIAFGQVAYELGFINRSQLDSALADQRSDFNQRFLD